MPGYRRLRQSRERHEGAIDNPEKGRCQEVYLIRHVDPFVFSPRLTCGSRFGIRSYRKFPFRRPIPAHPLDHRSMRKAQRQRSHGC
jgi:hypothetical protein